MARNLTAGALVLTVVTAQVAAWPGGRGGRGGGRSFNAGRNFNGYRTNGTFGNFGGQALDEGRIANEGHPTPADDGGELRRSVENGSAFQNFNRQGDRNRQFDDGQFQQKAQRFRQNMQKTASDLGQLYRSDNEPFSPAWYLEHPNAWQITHPYADAFVAASAATVGAWLGVNAYAEGGGGGLYGDDDAPFDTTGDDANVDLPSGNWLPLGVYALGALGQDESNTLIQLAVNRQGDLRGTYYDILTDEAQDIRGNVDKSTQVVTFTIGNNSKVTFETQLNQLIEKAAQVNVRFPGGAWPWQLVRLEK